MKKTLELKKEVVDRFNRLMNEEEVDFEKENLQEDSIAFFQTIDFGDGFDADLKVLTTNEKTLWCECVWFYHGVAYDCSDVSYELDGIWEDNKGHLLEVITA